MKAGTSRDIRHANREGWKFRCVHCGRECATIGVVIRHEKICPHRRDRRRFVEFLMERHLAWLERYYAKKR